MKKYYYNIALGIIILTLIVSCGGPKNDTKKMLKYIKEYIEVGEEAIKDRKIDNNDAKKLNEIKADIEKYSSKMDSIYDGNIEAQKTIQEVMNEEKNSKIMQDYANILMRLWKIEGYEKLK